MLYNLPFEISMDFYNILLLKNNKLKTEYILQQIVTLMLEMSLNRE
jgi:hypothetical protein